MTVRKNTRVAVQWSSLRGTIVSVLLLLALFSSPLAAQTSGGEKREEESRTVLYLRSNVLVPLFNVGACLPLGKKWRIEADWYYPWLSQEQLGGAACVEVLHGAVGLRKFFGAFSPDTHPSHSVGLSLHGTLFDLGLNKGGQDSFRLEGKQGECAGTSIDYLFSFPVGKVLLMEVGAGVGVVWHRDVSYTQYHDGGDLLRDPLLIETRGWYLGPTRLMFNIVYPLRIKRP